MSQLIKYKDVAKGVFQLMFETDSIVYNEIFGTEEFESFDTQFYELYKDRYLTVVEQDTYEKLVKSVFIIYSNLWSNYAQKSIDSPVTGSIETLNYLEQNDTESDDFDLQFNDSELQNNGKQQRKGNVERTITTTKNVLTIDDLIERTQRVMFNLTSIQIVERLFLKIY